MTTRRLPQAFFLCLVSALIGCSSNLGEPIEGTADARPIELNDPPEIDDPQTAPGCDGVDVRGECRGGERVSCNVQTNKLVTVDCEAMGSECVMDEQRGVVTCTPPPDPTSVNSCLAMGSAGICNGDKDVNYCLGADNSDIETQYCGAGEECMVNKCAIGGAYCCPSDFNDPPCPKLGSEGTCEDNKRKYCIGDTLKIEDCPAQGENCFIFSSGEAKCDGADIGP